MNVKNIYCVGRNYAKHAKELGNDLPSKPMIFSKPTHSLVTTNGQRVELPKNRGSIHYELELVFQLNRSYEVGMSPEDCISEMALGIDFTLRDEQEELKEKGHPWFVAKGFRNAALVTPFFPFEGIDKLNQSTFTLEINGQKVQEGDPNEMIFNLGAILNYCSETAGLSAGDLLFTGTPEGVGEIQTGDELKMYFNQENKGAVKIIK
ncbi:fumarylacetoacetate hydrolase family protein [Salipaludibacillus sp. HK11]|uniref:fumarylacetoacetate hydrolase family protein n=1 Tax=Salipaludibacillus sp. HK11 TaxID=3394320 RepID=UPI0039FC80AD